MSTTQQHMQRVALQAFEEKVAAGNLLPSDMSGFLAGWESGYAEKVRWFGIQDYIIGTKNEPSK